MEWTTTPPTEPGWYWVWDGSEVKGLVAVWESGESLLADMADENLGLTLTEFIEQNGVTQWYGPWHKPGPPVDAGTG